MRVLGATSPSSLRSTRHEFSTSGNPSVYRACLLPVHNRHFVHRVKRSRDLRRPGRAVVARVMVEISLQASSNRLCCIKADATAISASIVSLESAPKKSRRRTAASRGRFLQRLQNAVRRPGVHRDRTVSRCFLDSVVRRGADWWSVHVPLTHRRVDRGQAMCIPCRGCAEVVPARPAGHSACHQFASRRYRGSRSRRQRVATRLTGIRHLKNSPTKKSDICFAVSASRERAKLPYWPDHVLWQSAAPARSSCREHHEQYDDRVPPP